MAVQSVNTVSSIDSGSNISPTLYSEDETSVVVVLDMYLAGIKGEQGAPLITGCVTAFFFILVLPGFVVRVSVHWLISRCSCSHLCIVSVSGA